MIINTVMQGATVSGSVTPTGNPLPSKTWIPTTEDQIIEANSYTTGKQTIKGDPALIAGNIREGATIFNVPGTFTHVIESSVPSASDIRKGKQAYVNGNAIDGSLESRNLVTIDGSRILGEAGIYPSIDQYIPSASINFNNTISISGSAVMANINAFGSVVVTINGSIQSNYNVSQSGYVPSGSVMGTTTFTGGRTFSLPTVGGSTWTPQASTVDYVIPAGTYLTGSQIIRNDPNLSAENIKQGVQIYDMTGTHEGSDCITRSAGGTWEQICAMQTTIGWKEEKYSDGRLILWIYGWWNMGSGYQYRSVDVDATNTLASDGKGPTKFLSGTIPQFYYGTKVINNVNLAVSICTRKWEDSHIWYYYYAYPATSAAVQVAVCTKCEGRWA